MDEIEIAERLTKAEERAKSNTHRLDKVEVIVNEIHAMSNTMVELVQELKHTNETVRNLYVKVDRMDSRVDEMEKIPAKESGSAKKVITEKAVGAIVTFLIAGLLWAAVQAF